MSISLLNFFDCVTLHSKYKVDAKILIAYTKPYKNLVHDIQDTFQKQNSKLTIALYDAEESQVTKIIEELNSSDIYILFYDSDYAKSLGRPEVIQTLLPLLKKYWQKSCVFKDYGPYFAQAFGVNPKEQHTINENLIKIASNSHQFIYKDNYGSYLTADISGAKWKNISGIGNPDLVPGEIASYGNINGTINFIGTFLSVIPFAPIYGILDTPLSLTIENNYITSIKSENEALQRDMVKYINFNPSNAKIEELGIGTNSAVTKLYGINAGFEERHVGLHLGLGGALSGSDHLDLICQDGTLFFDEKMIIKDCKLLQENWI